MRKSKKLLFLAKSDSRVCTVATENILPLFEKEYEIHTKYKENENYDCAICFAPESICEKIKQKDKNCFIILLDPKLNNKRDEIEATNSDLVLVSSVEQEVYANMITEKTMQFNWFKQINLTANHRIEKNDKCTIIGYQGNKIHLNTLGSDIGKALTQLKREGYDIKFRAIYNIDKLGRWKKGLPDIEIEHIQWEEDKYIDKLRGVDIGIVPNLLPIGKRRANYATRTELNPRIFNYNKNDYIQRFKINSNPNRIWEFSQLKIPVIADMYPSTAMFIKHRWSGLLANGQRGWYESIKYMINNKEKRSEYARNLMESIE